MTQLAFLLYPLVVWMIFRTSSLVMAIPISFLTGLLLLPEGYAIALPMLPDISKLALPGIVTLFMALVFMGNRTSEPGNAVLDSWIPRPTWARVLLGCAIFSPILTVVFNREPLFMAHVTLPALTAYDAANMAQGAAITLIPFLMARRFLCTIEAHQAILLTIAVAGLLYSLPTLAEVRLSPQLHKLVYGYFQHSWIQHLRGEGFRPIVFFKHGLVLSLFLCMSTLAIIAYMRAADGDRRILYFLAAAYMTLVMYLSKSLGMVLVAATLIPVLLFFSIRGQLIVASAVALLVLSYPAIRAVGINPLMAVVETVQRYEPNRAQSLAYRLEAEDTVLTRMAEKPLFGWGGWGRAETWIGEEGARGGARDGLWIIVLGQLGVVGFIAQLGLMCGAMLAITFRQRWLNPTAATSGLCIVLSANLVDLIPNSGMTAITWIIAGSLLGWYELATATAQANRPEPAGNPVQEGMAGAALARTRGGDQTGVIYKRRADHTSTRSAEASSVQRTGPSQTEERPASRTKTTQHSSAGYSRFGIRHKRVPRRS